MRVSPMLLVLWISGLGLAQDLDRVRARVADLGDDDWAVREAATEDLVRMVQEDPTGDVEREVALGIGSKDPEVSMRCRMIHAVVEDKRLEIVVLEVQGEAEFQGEPRGKWLVVEKGAKIPRGARLCTGVESRLVLAVGSYGTIVMRDVSVLELRSPTVEWYGISGTLRVDPGRVELVSGPDPGSLAGLRVETPRLTASVR